MSEHFGDISSIIMNNYSIDVSGIEKRLLSLEESNRQLKELAFYKSEADRLRLEISSSKNLQQKYSKLYDDTSAQLLSIENTLIYEDTDEVSNLNSKVQLLIAANQELKNSIKNYQEQTRQAAKTKDYYNETVIPQLHSQIDLLRENMKKKGELSVENLANSEVAIGKVDAQRNRKSLNRNRISFGNTEAYKRTNSVVPCKTATMGVYTPSFLRKKVIVFKGIKNVK